MRFVEGYLLGFLSFGFCLFVSNYNDGDEDSEENI